MKKEKTRFVLAEATLNEVNKQLKINLFVIVVVTLVLFMNVMTFMAEKSFLYGALIAVMILLLFFLSKARTVLSFKKQELTQ